MKLCIVFFLLIPFLPANASLTISETVKTHNVEFIPHTKSGRFGSYLAMNIYYPAVKQLFLDLQKLTPKELKNRGEAHITTVTPVEYFNVLKEKISIKEINEIAHQRNIQHSDFKILCVGKFSKELNTDKDETFYIVVDSKNLKEIRKEIWQLFVLRGGDKNAFNYEKFYPHITLGFNKRDLHESDGAIKDANSCVYDLEVN